MSILKSCWDYEKPLTELKGRTKKRVTNAMGNSVSKDTEKGTLELSGQTVRGKGTGDPSTM